MLVGVAGDCWAYSGQGLLLTSGDLFFGVDNS